MKDLGNKIRQERKARKLTQEDLGKMVDSCSLTIFHLEHGENVGTKTLFKVCEILDLEIEIKQKKM